MMSVKDITNYLDSGIYQVGSSIGKSNLLSNFMSNLLNQTVNREQFKKQVAQMAVKFCKEYGIKDLLVATKPMEKMIEGKNPEEVAKECWSKLDQNEKNFVFGKIWELGKLKDCRIHGNNWGQENYWEDTGRLLKALHRLGFLGKEGLSPMPCLSLSASKGNCEAQYFSLGEKMGQDPITGEIGLVNGIGYESLDDAGEHASAVSNSFASGKNIHCVYMPTYGLLQDIGIVKAADGGSFVKTTYLIVQQWIDFLESNSEKKYLQVGVSGGGAQVNAALGFMKENRPDLLKRIRVLNLVSAHLILPETYPGIQVVNLFKKNDFVVIPIAANADCIDNPKYAQNLKEVAHTTQDHRHNFLSDDFVKEGKPFVDEFMNSGNLY